MQFYSETSRLNPRYGREWSAHDKIVCSCGKSVKVGEQGFAGLIEHQARTKHKNALRRKVEAAVAMREATKHNPTPAPAPPPVKPIDPAHDNAAFDLIRQLRRTIHALPAEIGAAEPDGPLASLVQGHEEPIQPLPVEQVNEIILSLFGPSISDEVVQTYVGRGLHGLDGLARWVRLHAHMRVGSAVLEPLKRLFPAIVVVAARHGQAVAVPDLAPSTPASTSTSTRIPPPAKPNASLYTYTPLAARNPHEKSTPSVARPSINGREPVAGPSHSHEPDAMDVDGSPPRLGSDGAESAAHATLAGDDRLGGCDICGPYLPQFRSAPDLLTHMSAHLLLDSRVSPDACSFCLQPPSAGCMMMLRNERSQFNLPRSVCPRKPERISYLPASRSNDSNPCSNVPYACPICPYDESTTPCIWKYSLQRHLRLAHPGVPIDQYAHMWEISETEVEGMTKLLRKAFWRVKSAHPVELRDELVKPSKAIPRTVMPPPPTSVPTPTSVASRPIKAKQVWNYFKAPPPEGPSPSGQAPSPPPRVARSIYQAASQKRPKGEDSMQVDDRPLKKSRPNDS